MQEKEEIFNTLCKLFSNKLRLDIFCFLKGGEKMVSDITAYVGRNKYCTSVQLKYLRERGLIEGRKEGRNYFYKITDEQYFESIDLITDKLAQNAALADCLKNDVPDVVSA